MFCFYFVSVYEVFTLFFWEHTELCVNNCFTSVWKMNADCWRASFMWCLVCALLCNLIWDIHGHKKKKQKQKHTTDRHHSWQLCLRHFFWRSFCITRGNSWAIFKLDENKKELHSVFDIVVTPLHLHRLCEIHFSGADLHGFWILFQHTDIFIKFFQVEMRLWVVSYQWHIQMQQP